MAVKVSHVKRPSASMTKQAIINQIARLLELAYVRSDGRPTKFALKYLIDQPKDFIALFKIIKENFKRGRESISFEIIIDMAKSALGRFVGSQKTPERYFMGTVWVFRTVGLAMDDLRLVKDAVKILEERLARKYNRKRK